MLAWLTSLNEASSPITRSFPVPDKVCVPEKEFPPDKFDFQFRAVCCADDTGFAESAVLSTFPSHTIALVIPETVHVKVGFAVGALPETVVVRSVICFCIFPNADKTESVAAITALTVVDSPVKREDLTRHSVKYRFVVPSGTASELDIACAGAVIYVRASTM